jgi:hypothetical protein
VVARGQVAALRGEEPGRDAAEKVQVDMCLQCQIRLSRMEVD